MENKLVRLKYTNEEATFLGFGVENGTTMAIIMLDDKSMRLEHVYDIDFIDEPVKLKGC